MRVRCAASYELKGVTIEGMASRYKYRVNACGYFNHSSVQFLPCLTLSWHTLIIFRQYMLSKPSWIWYLLTIKTFKDDDNLLANVIQNSYAGQVQCLSQSRDQKHNEKV